MTKNNVNFQQTETDAQTEGDEGQAWSHLNGNHRCLACAAALCVRCCTLHALLHVACAAALCMRCCALRALLHFLCAVALCACCGAFRVLLLFVRAVAVCVRCCTCVRCTWCALLHSARAAALCVCHCVGVLTLGWWVGQKKIAK